MSETSRVSDELQTLVANVGDLLNGPNAHDWVRGIHHLSLGVRYLEQQVIAEARKAGMAWEAIGDVYQISRQGAQQRFSGRAS